CEFGFYYSLYNYLVSFTSLERKKGLNTCTQKFLFGMTVFMFTLSSMLWVVTFVDVMRSIHIWLLDSRPGEQFSEYFRLFNALALINYFLTDGIVVWRAWVICHNSRKTLFIPIFLLGCTGVTMFATIGIGIRITLAIAYQSHIDMTHLNRAIDVSQVANLGLSLMTNIASILIIFQKAWRHREIFGSVVEKRTRASRIILLLVETGALYCISCTIALICSLFRLPAGTVGDIYMPVNIQFAGLYPIIVLLFVNQQQYYQNTVFTFTIPTNCHHSTLENNDTSRSSYLSA
ncbi:hypothetical protein K435DRAFT_671666, partial [Dendrothele bispora CBS 962.96]